MCSHCLASENKFRHTQNGFDSTFLQNQRRTVMGYFFHALINKALMTLSQEGRGKILSVQFLSSRWKGQGENCKNGAYDLKEEEPLYPEDAIILINE